MRGGLAKGHTAAAPEIDGDADGPQVDDARVVGALRIGRAQLGREEWRSARGLLRVRIALAQARRPAPYPAQA